MSTTSERIEIEHEDPYPNGFTQIDNRDIWDHCDKNRKLLLRPAALGVLTAMRSLPKGWQFHESWLMERSGLGRDALRRVIRDLKAAQRLSTRVVRDERGRYVRTIWRLLRPESPRTEKPAMGATRPLTDSQSVDRTPPLTGFPSPAKPTAGESTPLVITEKASKERTTTTDLIWDALPQFDAEMRAAAINQLAGLAGGTPQNVLDELAGALRNNAIEKPWPGWLRGLVKNAREGKFELNHALGVQNERERRKPSAPAARRSRLGLPPVEDVARPEVAGARMAAIRQALSSGVQDD